MNKKLLELYVNKFIKGELNLYGLILTPEIIDGKLFWILENPNDISYSRFAVKNLIEQSLEDFFKFVGDPFSGFARRKEIEKNLINFAYKIDDLYISPKLRNEIESEMREEVTVKFGEFMFTVQGFHYYLTSYHEEVTLETDMMIKKIENLSTGDTLVKKQIEKLLEQIHKDDYQMDLYETVSWHIGKLIYRSPTIFDQEESYFRDYVTFYDINKNRYEFDWG